MNQRLEGWGEIAGHFKRGLSTVQRWQKSEGLPVHKLEHHKRASVFAYKSELDGWYEQHTRQPSEHDAVRQDAGAAAKLRAKLRRILGCVFTPRVAVKIVERLVRDGFEFQPGAEVSGEFDVANEGSDAPNSGSESLSFLYHQRHRFRVEIARARWDSLIVDTYFHPMHGFTSTLPDDLWPRLISGLFTVADFAGESFQHETRMGANSPSDVRRHILRSKKTIVKELQKLVAQLEGEIERAPFDCPDSPWQTREARFAWSGLWHELSGKRFQSYAKLKSYCGFKDNFSVVDTAASGIRNRPDHSPANLFAYAASMELAWWVKQKDAEVEAFYLNTLAGCPKDKEPAHQFALRRTAQRLLKKVYQAKKAVARESRMSARRHHDDC